MIYAINKQDELIEATKTGQKAIDPFSKTEVISAVGEFNIPHWRLRNKGTNHSGRNGCYGIYGLFSQCGC